MSWKDTIQPEAKSSWKDTIKPEEEGIGKTQSAIAGGFDGLSLGFLDELAGAAEAALNMAGIRNTHDFSKMELGTPSFDLKENYTRGRDAKRATQKAAQEANANSYATGQVAGAVGASLVPGMQGATLPKLGLLGAAQGLGSSEADLTEGDVAGAARDTAIGGTIGAATGVAGKALSSIGSKAKPLINKATGKVADILDTGAEKLAVNATGATGREASRFAPNTGRELLDRRIVKFGRTAEGIEKATSEALESAGSQIDDVMRSLDASGATASVDNVVNALEARVSELSKTPGNESIIRQLQKEIDNLYLRGQSNILPSSAEAAKRNFQGQTNYFSPEFEKKATTQVGRAFKDEVERLASEASPELSKKFTDAKGIYGLLKPVQEAAEKRALQQSQSPFGGVGDFVAGAAGGAAGGPIGAAKAVAAKRLIQPRLASSVAVISDDLARIVRDSPEMLGRFAELLQRAAQRGTQALAATHYILQQTDPEYRKLVNTNEGWENEE